MGFDVSGEPPLEGRGHANRPHRPPHLRRDIAERVARRQVDPDHCLAAALLAVDVARADGRGELHDVAGADDGA